VALRAASVHGSEEDRGSGGQLAKSHAGFIGRGEDLGGVSL